MKDIRDEANAMLERLPKQDAKVIQESGQRPRVSITDGFKITHKFPEGDFYSREKAITLTSDVYAVNGDSIDSTVKYLSDYANEYCVKEITAIMTKLKGAKK